MSPRSYLYPLRVQLATCKAFVPKGLQRNPMPFCRSILYFTEKGRRAPQALEPVEQAYVSAGKPDEAGVGMKDSCVNYLVAISAPESGASINSRFSCFRRGLFRFRLLRDFSDCVYHRSSDFITVSLQDTRSSDRKKTCSTKKFR